MRNDTSERGRFRGLSVAPSAFTSFSRTFWHPEAAGRLAGELTFGERALDWEAVERFRALVDLNLARLREQVRTCLLAADSVLLSQVLERFPPREGILEVVGYLVVARCRMPIITCLGINLRTCDSIPTRASTNSGAYRRRDRAPWQCEACRPPRGWRHHIGALLAGRGW